MAILESEVPYLKSSKKHREFYVSFSDHERVIVVVKQDDLQLLLLLRKETCKSISKSRMSIKAVGFCLRERWREKNPNIRNKNLNKKRLTFRGTSPQYR